LDHTVRLIESTDAGISLEILQSTELSGGNRLLKKPFEPMCIFNVPTLN